MLGSWPRRALIAGALGLLACSVVVEADQLNEGCGAGQKACGGECVALDDPDFGCGPGTCRPCVIAHATARCSARLECVVAACQGQFDDCNADGDRQSSDGCEVDTAHDPEHCGGCNAEPCQTENGAPDCAGGGCSIARCNTGYRDCNFEIADGCEVELGRDPQHCGDCDNACHTSQSCIAAECR